jgi:anaerobic magnesium-protoporphyrin IX monomethyl ester cyclase
MSMIKKILLIMPPDIRLTGEDFFVTFPLGLGYIAGVLERNNYDVSVLDCIAERPDKMKVDSTCYHLGLSWGEIEERIRHIKPDMVGISCLFSAQFPSAEKVAAIVKAVGDIPVVVGGAHASGVPSEVLKSPCIDFAAIGEGEETILELLKELKRDQRFDRIDGLGYRRNGEIIVNEKTRFIQDVDTLPLPARHLFPMERYLGSSKTHSFYTKRKPSTTMITSRGCPHNCTFCSIHTVWGTRYRPRDPIQVVDEIELLMTQYGVREVHFEDDNITLNRQRIQNICREIMARGLDVTWTTPNGISVSTLDRETVSLMRQSGCYRVFLGIESGNQEVLSKIIRKRISLEQVRAVCQLLKEYSIEATGFFVLGMPGETRETIRDTIDFAKSLNLTDVLFSIATPYPGTTFYSDCVSKRLIESCL